MKYNSVILDMDGVMLDFEGDDFQWKYDVIRSVLRDHGVEPEGMERAELDSFLGDKGVEKCIETCNSHGLDTRTVWNDLAEATTHARAKRIKKGDFCLFPEVEEVIEKLHKMDVKLGVVSNAPEMAIMEMIHYFGLKEYFKFFRGIENFEDLSDRKPNPDHLEFARAELKREPFIYAGDRESDIKAAENAGMDSLWVNRNDRNSSSFDIRPDYESEDLRQLISITKGEE